MTQIFHRHLVTYDLDRRDMERLDELGILCPSCIESGYILHLWRKKRDDISWQKLYPYDVAH